MHHPDFRTRAAEDQARERLRSLLGRLPYGSKAQLARVCGFATRRLLRDLTKPQTWWLPAVRRRIERVLDAIEAGHLVLCATGRPPRSPKGQYVWVWREQR
jgi:hypothetical protein